MNRSIVAAVVLVFALSLSCAQNAEARRRFGRFGGRGFGYGGGRGALAALAVGGLVASTYNPYYGGGYYGGYYDPYYAPVAYPPVAYAPGGYGYGGYGYAPYGYGYRPYRRRSVLLPALIGAGIGYAIGRGGRRRW